jgi:hypothetical protein
LLWGGHTADFASQAITVVEQELDLLDEWSWRELLIGEDEFTDSDADVHGWRAYEERGGFEETGETEEESETSESVVDGFYFAWYSDEDEVEEDESEAVDGWDSGDYEVVGWDDDVEVEQEEEEDETDEEGDEVRWVRLDGSVYYGPRN